MSHRAASRALLAASLLALLLPACPSRGAFEISWPDARAAAMLAPSSLLCFEPGSVSGRVRADSLGEPSGIEGARATLSSGRLYCLSEAAGWSARASKDLWGVTASFEISRLGGELYAERVLSIGAAVRATDGLRLSARVRALGIAARRVEDRWAVAADGGVTKRLMGRFLVGAACENLGQAGIGGSQIAARTVFGAALVLPSMSLQCTLLIEETFAPSPTLGFEASLTDWVRIRAGARDAPGRLGLGVGVGRGRGAWPTVDLSIQWHPRLGVSSFVSVTIES